MSKLTQEFLDKLIKTQDELNDMYEKLDGYITDLVRWEHENLGEHSGVINGPIIVVCVENGELKVKTLEDNNEGTCDECEYLYPLYKLLTDSWKEEALKERQAKLEKEKKEQCMKEEARAREVEEKERAEYERLKAKFEKM